MMPQGPIDPGPRCPHCEAQPCKIGMRLADFGQGAIAGIFTCGECHKILSVSPMPMMMGPEPPQQSLIVPPGRM